MSDIHDLSYDELKEYLQKKHLNENVHELTAKEIYDMAWEMGHAYGNSEVESFYIDLAILVKDALLRKGF